MADLNDDDIELAQNLINDMPAGKFEIDDIYGEFWPEIAGHQEFGRRFKKAVLAKRLKGIEWCERNIKNHQVYLVGGG